MMYKKLCVIFAACLVFLSGCDSKAATVPTLAEPVGLVMDTAVVSRGDIYNLVTYDAKVYPDVKEVSFAKNGKLKDIKVLLGQKVHKGDVLMHLNDTDLEKELESLGNELKDMQINNEYNNSQAELDIQIQELNLKKKQSEKASNIDIAQTKADIEKAKLILNQNIIMQQFELNKKNEKIDKIKTKLEQYTLKSPYTGTVVYMKELHRNYDVSAKETVVAITDDSKLHLQSEYLQEAVIKNASQIYALINGKQYNIEYVPLTAEERINLTNGQGVVETSYLVDNDGGFTIGDYACICIKDKAKSNVLTIPSNSLHSDSKGSFVYLEKDGTVKRVYVEVGITTNTQVEIIDGLKEGDVIYVQG